MMTILLVFSAGIRIIYSNARTFLYLIKNIGYFLLRINSFERGSYSINAKLIYKVGSLRSQHLLDTVAIRPPRVIVYNPFGCNVGGDLLIGFHPDQRYKIDFNNKTIIRTYYDDHALNHYSILRTEMTAFIPAPRFDILGALSYREEFIDGFTFQLAAGNLQKFDSLLSNFLALVGSTARAIRYSCNSIERLVEAVNYAYRKVDADRDLLFELLVHANMVVSKGSDLAGPNLLESDSGLFLIDWEPKELKYRRAWIDPVNLIVKCDFQGLIAGDYTKYIAGLFSACGVDHDFRCTDREIRSILFASLLCNLPELHKFDLRFDFNRLPCSGLSRIKTFHIQKVIRSTLMYMRRYA
jgi:hypothetical protein